MESNLDGELSIDNVSEVASMSRYHYSRLFRMLTNESVMGYVRKRRLSVAAERLVAEETRVTEIALASGFESHEAFTRAFKRMFSLTPSAFRRRQKPLWSNFRHPLNVNSIDHLKEGMTMQPIIKSYPAFKIVGLKGSYTPETNVNIPALWERFMPRLDAIKHRTGDLSFGLCNPSRLPEFDYYAAVQVDSLDDVPEGMHGFEVAEHRYAVFTHKGRLVNLRETVAYIWGTWIPGSVYTSPALPDFELYGEQFDPGSDDSELEIYIPIEDES